MGMPGKSSPRALSSIGDVSLGSGGSFDSDPSGVSNTLDGSVTLDFFFFFLPLEVEELEERPISNAKKSAGNDANNQRQQPTERKWEHCNQQQTQEEVQHRLQ